MTHEKLSLYVGLSNDNPECLTIAIGPPASPESRDLVAVSLAAEQVLMFIEKVGAVFEAMLPRSTVRRCAESKRAEGAVMQAPVGEIGPKCGTVSCARTATKLVQWPGDTIPMCDPCTARAERIGSAMGCSISWEALS